MVQTEPFRRLKVWEKSHALTIDVYHSTERYPKHELFGLVSQMRRAAVSVTANIVEGVKRKSVKDRQHFMMMADTSLEELKYFIILSTDLGYLTSEQRDALMKLSREVGMMLNAFTRSML